MSKQNFQHFFNGEFLPYKDLNLHVSDLGILRGHAIFDFFLVKTGKALFIDDYLNRFENSAREMGLHFPIGKKQLKNTIAELIDRNQVREGGIRLLLTGGYTQDGYSIASPNLLALLYPPNPPKPDCYTTGIKLQTLRFQRPLPQVKTTSYFMSIRQEAAKRKAGVFEFLLHDERRFLEAERSNFFLILEGARLLTADSDILFGITRKKVLELAPQICQVETRAVLLEELPLAQEAFITGSNKGVMPVVAVDGHPIGNGKPGPLTKKLSDLFHNLTDQYSSGKAFGS